MLNKNRSRQSILKGIHKPSIGKQDSYIRQTLSVQKNNKISNKLNALENTKLAITFENHKTSPDKDPLTKKKNNVLKIIKTNGKNDIYGNQKIDKAQANKYESLIKRCEELILVVKNFIHVSIKLTKMLNESQKQKNTMRQFTTQKNCLEQFIRQTENQLNQSKFQYYQPTTISSKLILDNSGQYTKDINNSTIIISSEIQNKQTISKEKLYQSLKNQQLQLIKKYIKNKIEPNQFMLFNKLVDQSQKQYKLKLILRQPITKEKQIELNEMIKFTRSQINQLLLQYPIYNNQKKTLIHKQQTQTIQDKLKEILAYLKVSLNETRATSTLYMLELIELKLYNLKIDLIPVLRKTNQYLQKQNKTLRNDLELKTIQFNKLFEIKNELESEIQGLNSVKMKHINYLLFYESLLLIFEEEKSTYKRFEQQNLKLKTQEKYKVSKQIIRYRRKVNSMEDIVAQLQKSQLAQSTNKSKIQISTQYKFDEIIQFFKGLINKNKQQHTKFISLQEESRNLKLKYTQLQQNLKIIYIQKESELLQLQRMISDQETSCQQYDKLREELACINTEKQQLKVKLKQSNKELQIIQNKILEILKNLIGNNQHIQEIDKNLMEKLDCEIYKNKQQNLSIKLQLNQKNKIIQMQNSIIINLKTEQLIVQNSYKFNILQQNIDQILRQQQSLQEESNSLKQKLEKCRQNNQQYQQIIKQMKENQETTQKKIQTLENINNQIKTQLNKKIKQNQQQKVEYQIKYQILEQMNFALLQDKKNFVQLNTQLSQLKNLLRKKEILIQGMEHQLNDYEWLRNQYQKQKIRNFQNNEKWKSKRIQYQKRYEKLLTDIINQNSENITIFCNIYDDIYQQENKMVFNHRNELGQSDKNIDENQNKKMKEIDNKIYRIKQIIYGYKIQIDKIIVEKEQMRSKLKQQTKKLSLKLDEYGLINNRLQQQIEILKNEIKSKQEIINYYKLQVQELKINKNFTLNSKNNQNQQQKLINENKLLKQTYQRQFKANLIIINKLEKQLKNNQNYKLVSSTNLSFSSSFYQCPSISTQTQQKYLEQKIQIIRSNVNKLKSIKNDILIDFNKNREIIKDITTNFVTFFRKFNLKFQDLINLLIKKFKISVQLNSTDVLLDVLNKSITQLDLKQYQYYEVLQKLIDQFLFNKVSIDFQQQMKQLSQQNKQKIITYRKKIGDIQSIITRQNHPDPKLDELNNQLIFYKNELKNKEKQITFLQSQLNQKNILITENYNKIGHQSQIKQKDNTLFQIQEPIRQFNHQEALSSLLDESAICNNDQLEFVKWQLSKCLKQNGTLKDKLKKVQTQYLNGYKFVVQSLNGIKLDIEPETDQIYQIYTRINQIMKQFRTTLK